MIQLEIDGKQVEVQEGTMLIEATKSCGQYVPHFCYHKKLSIAANCRMCLVEVEKAPKPLPACATPVTQGMKVFTNSEKVKQAQKSVMEFLLINHPLDCPICDQGGECQLQDLAVGYGAGKSRYTEEKRIVVHKKAGPLISLEEMSRCIHCTRCVRFGQEIAGIMELGMVGRGEHSEITSFVEQAITSELSGNMIDICPVGAITSKPFRYSARTWELSRRSSISSHDALGSNLIVQVKNNRVMRVLPQENEDINECWISDKDRFSYDGLYHEDRIKQPLVKDDKGEWHEVDWQFALSTLKNKMDSLGLDISSNISSNLKYAGLFNAKQTLEEIYLFKKLIKSIDDNGIVEFRLKHADRAQNDQLTANGLGDIKIKDISKFKQISLVGSFLKNDHPLLCAKIRSASKNGTIVNSVNASSSADWFLSTNVDVVIPPSLWLIFLEQVRCFVIGNEIINDNLSEKHLNYAKELSQSLKNSKDDQLLLIGSNIIYHPKRHVIYDILQGIAISLNCKIAVLADKANMVGSYNLDAYSENSYHDLDAYFLMGIDIDYDTSNSKKLKDSLKKAQLVVSLSSYSSPSLLEYSNIILPISTSFETSGSFINMENRLQSFQGVVQSYENSRPAWKIIKVIADFLEYNNFDYQSSEDVLHEIKQNIIDTKEISVANINLKFNDLYNNEKNKSTHKSIHLERISYDPIYSSDEIVRHSNCLKKTKQAISSNYIYANSKVMKEKNIASGDIVNVLQGQNMCQSSIILDDKLDDGVLMIPTTHEISVKFDALYGDIAIEKV